MMKLLILTLAAVCVGFSEGYDSLNPPRPEGYTNEETLIAFFNIQKDEVEAKCDKVDDDAKTRWEKVEKKLKALTKAVSSITDYGDYQAQKDVIETALPCATQEQKDAKLTYYKNLPNNQPQGKPTTEKQGSQ